jgi:predicted DNA binding CopG/RHH family protein
VIRCAPDEGKRCAETLFFDYWRQHRRAGVPYQRFIRMTLERALQQRSR